MKILIRFISIIGLVSMSQAAIAIDNVSDGDVLTADTMNEIIDATNANSGGFDFDIENPCNGGTRYSVGDMGPAGGWVFITDSSGCKGLEAWTNDEGILLNWGCLTVVAGAKRYEIGSGAPNTQAIIDKVCLFSGAAHATRNNGPRGGQDDWYLPSQDELVEMHKTIGPGGTNIGGFTLGSYWSSSEISNTEAVRVNFNGGAISTIGKASDLRVRAIRTFNNE